MYAPSLAGIAALVLIPATAIALAWTIGHIVGGIVKSLRPSDTHPASSKSPRATH